MHFVSESAIQRESAATKRRRETTHRISTCAQLLTEERGLDGFTMDDLADAVGVSRRTLFNHFDGKIDAVLGRWQLDDELVARFVAGGPNGDLVRDLHSLVSGILDTAFVDRETLARGKRILLGTPRLLTAVHGRYEEISQEVVEHIVRREGADFPAPRAQVAVRLLAALLEASLNAFLDDSTGRPMAEHFDHTLDAARSLLG